MSDRFEVSQHDNQIYVTEMGAQMLHAEVNGPMDTTVQIGYDGRVEIDKMYGPTIFWSVRVSCDLATCEWVIERCFGPEGEWREVHRVPGQLDSDFTDRG